jgi:uncharacterized protein (UPF0332 family)
MTEVDAIRLRLEQAHESLKEAETLKKNSLFRGTINRAYYAMFYAVMALAAQKNYAASKHSGMIAFFDKEYIKTKIFPAELSRSLHMGFDRRQASDYGEVWMVDEEEASAGLSQAIDFVQRIDTYLNKTK